MELQLHHRYQRDEAIIFFNKSNFSFEIFCNGDFVVLPHAILCFATIGNSNEPYFQSPSCFIWKPQSLDFEPDDQYSWFPEQVREVWTADRKQKLKEHHIFARLATDDNTYIYVGDASLSSYGYDGQRGEQASFTLSTKLSRKAWLALGGKLQSKNRLVHLSEITSKPVDLTYHKNAFQLLRLTPQLSKQGASFLSTLKQNSKQPLPEAIHEWYGLEGALDILHEIFLPNSPNTFEHPERDKAYMARYGATAPCQRMLPIAFENQGVWHLAVPLDAGENPPVYLGYDEEDSFEWYLHAHSFSEFIWAWTWDYLTYSRDYLMDVSEYLQKEDVDAIDNNFQKGPQTYISNTIFHYKIFQRYSKGDQKVTVMKNEDSCHIWFSAESGESLERLLTGPWTKGSILARNSKLDIEMQKMYLW